MSDPVEPPDGRDFARVVDPTDTRDHKLPEAAVDHRIQVDDSRLGCPVECVVAVENAGVADIAGPDDLAKSIDIPAVAVFGTARKLAQVGHRTGDSVRYIRGPDESMLPAAGHVAVPDDGAGI